MTNVLVTGGAGFIGSHLVRALADAGHTVAVLDNLSTGKRLNLVGVECCLQEGSIRDDGDLETALAEKDVVFHLAALPSVLRGERYPLESVAVNAGGTAALLRAAKRAGVKRVVIASSSSVYGNIEAAIKSEELAPRPLSVYAISKWACEKLADAYTRMGLPCVCLRYFNVFGPRQSAKSEYAAVIPRFIQQTMRGEPCVIYGDGQQTRDFTYVDNVVEATMLAGFSDNGAGDVFNVGCGASISLFSVVSAIEDFTGEIAKCCYEPERSGDIKHSLASIEKINRVFGYKPVVSFREGLQRTVAWHGDR